MSNYWPVFLMFAGVLLFVLGGITFWFSEEDSIVYDSYELNNQNEAFTFLIGESELLQSKSEQQSEEGLVSSLIKKADYLPMLTEEKIHGWLERVYLAVIDQSVSNGNIVMLDEGEIVSNQIEDELTVHSIEEAGEESEYDFYAGTYENGYLIGGTITQSSFEYDVLESLDDRIRDIEVADVDGDGLNEVLVTTHFDGITAIFDSEDWSYEVIDREEYGEDNTYSHEVEAGDVTGDGSTDIVATPSEPNTWDEEQSGVVKLFVRENGEWQNYSSGELEKSHIRKVKINPEDNSIVGGIGQRDEPYDNNAAFIKYRFDGEGLVEEDRVVSSDAMRNFYPFLVERDEGNLVVGLSSDSRAHVIDAESFDDLYVEDFSRSFEAFYTAKAFDYTGDNQDELAIVNDGELVIYEVTEDGMTELESIEVYTDFDSSMIWTIEALRK